MKYWARAIKFKLCGLIIGLLAYICAIPSAYSQQFKFEGGRTRDGMLFDVVKNLIIIPLYINQKGPFNFVLDTGVGPMIITNPSLIDTLGLKDLRTVKIKGFGAGEDIDAFVGKTESIRLSTASAVGIQTLILKKDVFNLSGYVGKNITGLIGYNFFSSFTVKVNYPATRLTFSLPGKYKRLTKGERIPIELIENKPYLHAKVHSESLGKIDVKLIIDCGASHALSLESFENKEFPSPKNSIIGSLGVGLSGEISGLIGRSPKLTIGSYTFSDVITNFPKHDEAAAKTSLKDRNGNLGSEILKRFDVTYDYQNNAIYLKKNATFKIPFEHDMSGIEVYRENTPDDAYIIGRIEPNSPASTADLRIGDEIVGINFKKMQDYTLDEITALFKLGNDRTVIIEIFRDNATIIKLLKLKKRI